MKMNGNELIKRTAWIEQNDGSLVAKWPPFAVTIFRAKERHLAHFLLYTLDPCRGDLLLQSGTAHDVEQAKKLAEAAVAQRLALLSGQNSIMVIGNDDVQRQQLVSSLRASGYWVIEASSYAGALRRLDRIAPPDFLIIRDADRGGLRLRDFTDLALEMCPTTSMVVAAGEEDLQADIVVSILKGLQIVRDIQLQTVEAREHITWPLKLSYSGSGRSGKQSKAVS